MNASQNSLYLSEIPVAEAGMLVRRTAKVVYEAFINPEVTTHFWFSRSSGRLEPGKRVRWEWEMYGVTTSVVVKELVPEKRILLVWNAESNPTQVEWKFTSSDRESTFVSITNSGFTGSADQIVSQAMDSAAGFALVLAGLKAYLEHGINLNLVADRFPDQHIEPGSGNTVKE